jgi:hypothetical protein
VRVAIERLLVMLAAVSLAGSVLQWIEPPQQLPLVDFQDINHDGGIA